jgi:EpsI family protein
MRNRILLAVVILVVIQGVAKWVSKGREPDEVRPLAVSLSSLPMRFGTWKGHDEQMDPRLGAAVGAVDVANRQYEEEHGGKIALQIASFTTSENSLPHAPEVCYRQAGWGIVERRIVELRVDDEKTRPAQLLVFDQDRQRIIVLYWYQFGNASVTDVDGLRQSRWAYFGQKSWPPVIKVMVQIPMAPDAVRAEKTIRAFSELVLGWTKSVS